MKKVLVTGATGFIGRHCLEFLVKRDFDIHAVTVHDKPHNVMNQCSWHSANLLDINQINQLLDEIRPQYLLHFAWDVTPQFYLNSNENFKWLQSSLELLRAFHTYGGKRIVMAGTCFEYELKSGYCSEQYTPLVAQNVYSVCKHSLNTLLRSYSERNGLSAAWGRIFYLYGPGEHPARLVSSVISSLLQGKFAQCSHGRQIRDYLHVSDVAEAFVTLLDSEVIGDINICSGIPVSLREIIEKIGAQLNKAELIKLGERIVSKDEPPFIVGNPTKLQTCLHWLPKYTLDEGLSNTIMWWEKHLAGGCNYSKL